MNTPREGHGVKSAERTLSILALLAERGRPVAFREIAETLRYPRSSLHGLVRTLSRHGWVERDPHAHGFMLGVRAWQIGHAYLRGRTLVQRAQPYMERVRDALDETVQLAVLDGRHNVYIARVEGTQRLTLISDVGGRLVAHATGLGKALLADLPPNVFRRLFRDVHLERFTRHTIGDLRQLEQELERIRHRGYALDREEYTVGVRCVAVPVRGDSGSAVAAMSVSVPTVRYSARLQRDALRVLAREAGALSLALGGTAAPAGGQRQPGWAS